MISPGLFIPPADNPYALKLGQTDLAPLLLTQASREFKLALAAGVEMRSKTEHKPDGRVVFTIETVPLVGIAELGDGRVRVYTKPRT